MRISDWSSDVCSSDLVVSMGRMSLTNKDRVSDGYQLRQAEKQSDGSTKKMMACMTCGTLFYLKSDIAISQELQRISSYLEPLAEPSCPSPACENHAERSEEHTSELQSLMRTSYDLFCFKKKT